MKQGMNSPANRKPDRPAPAAPRKAPAPFWPLWGWPLLLAALTLVGLSLALLDEGGWGDWLAAACLALPVAVCVWHGWLRR